MPKSPTSSPRVMVSSTFVDLKEHRAAAFDALLANNLFPVGMEANIGTPDDHVISSSLAMVESAAAYICLIGQRYGQTPVSADDNPHGLSVTELEFDKAVALGLPIRLLVMGDEHPIRKIDIEHDHIKQQKLSAFVAKAKRLPPTHDLHRVYQTFDSLDGLRVAIQRTAVTLRDHFNSIASERLRKSVPQQPDEQSASAPQPGAAANLHPPPPWLGRLVFAIAAAALLLAVLGYADPAIRSTFEVDIRATPWLRVALLFLVPLAIMLAQGVIEWRARTQARRQQILAISATAVPPGHFRTEPYTDSQEDQAAYDRADGAHQRILNWLCTTEGAPLYLTGESGCGKSSLLRAFVLPMLRKKGFEVAEPRALADPVAALAAALAPLPGAPPTPASPRALIEAVAAANRTGLVIVFDQFEEFGVLGATKARHAFAALLHDLNRRPVPGLRLLLSFPSIHGAKLDDLDLPEMRARQNEERVGPFSRTDARQFLAKANLRLSHQAIDKLLASAARLDGLNGPIRPVTLNYLGHVLASGYDSALTLDADILIATFLARVVGAEDVRDHAPRVLPHLILDGRRTQPRSEDDLCHLSKLDRGHVRAVMNALDREGLARRLHQPERLWELSHDYIAEQIARLFGRLRRQRAVEIAAYVGPALLALVVSAVVAMIATNRAELADDSARARLVDIGLAVSPSIVDPQRLHLQVTNLWGPHSAAAATPLLQRFAARVGSFDGARHPMMESLAPLAGLRALYAVDLAGTRAADLAPLALLPTLIELDLSYTSVVGLKPLDNLTTLRSLNLKGTRVFYLGPLGGLTGLQALNLRATSVVDITVLEPLQALRTLDLGRTRVANLAPVAHMRALHSLDLAFTPVDDLAPLRHHPSLETLDLRGATRITTLAPLATLPNLRDVNISELPAGIERTLGPSKLRLHRAETPPPPPPSPQVPNSRR